MEVVEAGVEDVFDIEVDRTHNFIANGLEVSNTRWHEDDQSGRLLQRMADGTGEPWELVRIPDIAEGSDPTSSDVLRRLPDPLGRKPGEIIEPERFSLIAVRARHLTAGSYLTAALYQQRPAPEEGGEIKRAWWKLADSLPPRYDDSLSSWDMKLKDREAGDYVVGQAWGRTGSNAWLVDQLRGQWNQAETENAIALLSYRNPWLRVHVIENTGNGPEVMAALRAQHRAYSVSDEIASKLGMSGEERTAVALIRQRGMPGLIANNPKGRKEVRMRAVSGFIEAGNVHLWARASWLGGFLDELSAFNNGTHDDQVDACSQALSKLLRASATVRSPQGTVPSSPISTRGPVEPAFPAPRSALDRRHLPSRALNRRQMPPTE